MKSRRFFLIGLAAWILATVWVAGFEILAFESTGELTFSELPSTANYHVEVVSSPKDFPPVSSPSVISLSVTSGGSSGQVTCTVPTDQKTAFFRIAAAQPSPAIVSPAPTLPETMVMIPGGANEGEDPDFGSYSVTVDTFYMDKTLVPKWLWDQVFNWAITNGYSFVNTGRIEKVEGGPPPAGTNPPVHSVCWFDCAKWCNARSEMEGRPPVYAVNGQVYRTGHPSNVVQNAVAGYRLPTTNEWQYAARGGLVGQRFPWGDEVSHTNANYLSGPHYSTPRRAYDVNPTDGQHPEFGRGTNPVDYYAPNGYGLHDMAGNLEEWCFADYRIGYWYPTQGGAWWSPAHWLRNGNVESRAGYTVASFIGFRTVLTPADVH